MGFILDDDKLEDLNYWRLLDEICVIDAVILITGNNPSVKQTAYDGLTGEPQRNSDGTIITIQNRDYANFEPVFKALRNAIFSNKISARISFSARINNMNALDGEESIDFAAFVGDYGGSIKVLKNTPFNNLESAKPLKILKEPNWEQTTVNVDDLKEWLESRSLYPDFFFLGGASDGFRNKTNSRYSPKLACAVAAWEAVDKAQPNKSVKESISAWVQSNGLNYGVAGTDGAVPSKANEQISAVVNWNTRGGATPTASTVGEMPKVVENFDDIDATFTDDNMPF